MGPSLRQLREQVPGDQGTSGKQHCGCRHPVALGPCKEPAGEKKESNLKLKKAVRQLSLSSQRRNGVNPRQEK